MIWKTEQDFRFRELALLISHDWLIIYEWCACTKQVVAVFQYVHPIVERFEQELVCLCEDCIKSATEGIQAQLEACAELFIPTLHRVGASLDTTFHQGPWHDN